MSWPSSSTLTSLATKIPMSPCCGSWRGAHTIADRIDICGITRYLLISRPLSHGGWARVNARSCGEKWSPTRQELVFERCSVRNAGTGTVTRVTISTERGRNLNPSSASAEALFLQSGETSAGSRCSMRKCAKRAEPSAEGRARRKPQSATAAADGVTGPRLGRRQRKFLHRISAQTQSLLIFPLGGHWSYVSRWAVSYPIPENPQRRLTMLITPSSA